MKMCLKCKQIEAIEKERYCAKCKKDVLAELKAAGYLQKAPYFGRYTRSADQRQAREGDDIVQRRHDLR